MSSIRQAITPALRRWIAEQTAAGQPPAAVLAAMRASGWQAEVAADALAQALEPAAPAAADAGPRSAVPEPPLDAAPACVRAGDRDVQVLLQMRLPRVVVFGGLLADDECDRLVAAARPRLARSETVQQATGGSEVHATRTSRGMFFQREEDELIARIERRIAALLRWPLARGEGLQVLHYAPGARYEPHHDYFDPAQPGTARIVERGGQRVATVVMYLNTPQRGGATTFPDVGLDVGAVKGHAVFFSYDRPDPATLSLHAGAPVLEGEKWIATKWLREREFG
jgi:prolyl 4-hydroxylase